jgi:hypothetical protein
VSAEGSGATSKEIAGRIIKNALQEQEIPSVFYGKQT